MKASDQTIIIDSNSNSTHAEAAYRRTFFQAARIYFKGSNKLQLFAAGRVVLLILAGYAPIAALNDVLAPLAFGLPLLDNFGIPIGILAAVKIYFDIRKIQLSPRHIG